MISEIQDPFERYCAFLIERDAIYKKKSSGEEAPWTTDPILHEYRFTEIYRERDRTSIHYQKIVRDFYTQDDPMVLPGTVLYRWFNRIATCNELFNQSDFDHHSVFERYIVSNCEKASIL